MPTETVRLRIANLGKAVLVSGQAYQEPKDALNEFVSNAADEYAEAGRGGARITLHLRRRGRHPLVAVSDEGRGMSQDRLRQVARNLFESTKAGDERTLGRRPSASSPSSSWVRGATSSAALRTTLRRGASGFAAANRPPGWASNAAAAARSPAPPSTSATSIPRCCGC